MKKTKLFLLGGMISLSLYSIGQDSTPPPCAKLGINVGTTATTTTGSVDIGFIKGGKTVTVVRIDCEPHTTACCIKSAAIAGPGSVGAYVEIELDNPDRLIKGEVLMWKETRGSKGRNSHLIKIATED
jgi:hypothetical protein